MLWRVVRGSQRRVLVFSVVWAAGFLLVVAGSWAGERWLDHLLRFALPLATVVFVISGVLTVWLDGTSLSRSWRLLAVSVVVALAVGIGLAGQGDEKSGRLELPPRTGQA